MNIADSRVYVEHVQHMFSPQRVERLRRHLLEVEGPQQAIVATERERLAVSRGVTTDALRMDPVWFEIWRELPEASRKALGPFCWVIFPPQVRILRQLPHCVPWHQDIAYQRLLGSRCHWRVITCFIPLDENPWERATVEFGPSEEHEVQHVPMGMYEAGIPRDSLDGWHYLLRPGDCLLFGDYAIHRTFLPKDAVLERRSLELRLVRRQDALDVKDYFDVDSGQMVRKGPG
jgi:hypothetical protein